MEMAGLKFAKENPRVLERGSSSSAALERRGPGREEGLQSNA